MAYDWRGFLRQEMQRQGLNPKQVSLAAGRSDTYIRDILDGKGGGKPPSEPSAKALAAVAKVLGMSLAKLYFGEENAYPKITVIGSVSGDELWAPSKKGASVNEIEFRVEGGEPVALQVHGDGLALAGYRDGDLLIGAKRAGTNADNLLGLECIILTEKGERHVRYLARGNVRGTFNLRSHDATVADVINVRVQWAAPVEWIKRAKH